MAGLKLKRPLFSIQNDEIFHSSPNKRIMHSKIFSPPPPIPTSSFSRLTTEDHSAALSLPSSTSSSSSSSNLNNRMKVYVRVRPLNHRETIGDNRIVVDIVDDQMMIFDPKINNPQYYYHGKMYKEIGTKLNKNLQFVFDTVFDEESTNEQVYEGTTKCFVENLLNGFNCTVFAYGATGSGKTYTMLGTNDDPGVIFFTTMHLFQKIEEKENEQLEVSVSYLEIYNENVYDLLSPSVPKRTLPVCEDSQKGVGIKNLSVHKPKDANHILELLNYGNKNRTQHPTDANAESSRSHAIFQIFLRKQDFKTQEMSVQLSKMSLIDLAGSERATVANRSKRSKDLHREGGNINKSLLALGNCITALTKINPRQKNVPHIPYRNSKLTLLLRDSLGGNCQTAMIATISPSSLHYEETHNTLVYADRAKGIKLNVRRNSFSVGLQPRNYNSIIEQLNKKNIEQSEQNIMLQAEIQKLRNQLERAPSNPINSSNNSIDMLNSAKNSLDLLFEERMELRRNLMECESHIKKIELKLLLRKLDAERFKLLSDQKEGSATKNDPCLALRNQKLHYCTQRETYQKSVKENEDKIKRFESDLKEQIGCDDWFIDTYFKNQDLIAESKDKSYAERHAVEIAKELFSRLESGEEIMNESVKLNRHAYHILNGMKRLSEELSGSFNSLLRKVEGKKNVAWRDFVNSPAIVKQKDVENIFILPTYSAIPQTPIANTTRQLVSVYSITP